MLTNDETPKSGILYIDDEEMALKYFRRAYGSKFNIFTASSGEAGLEVLQQESKNIAIVLTDQRMPNMEGSEVLAAAREAFPKIVRILTTAYSDLESAILAVNKGHIYQYVVKPWEIPELGMVLQRAADYFHVMMERDQLLALKMTTLQRIICSDRLKLLMLASRGWSAERQSAFRRALPAFIAALPDSLNPVIEGIDGFSHRHFEIGSLIRDEYRNATRCLDILDARLPESAAGFETASLSAALATMDYLTAEDIDVSVSNDPNWSLQVTLRPPAAKVAACEKTLFGLLLERDTSDVSLELFAAVATAALAQGRVILTLAVPDAEPREFVFAPSAETPDSPDEAIAGLYEKFSSWDILRR